MVDGEMSRPVDCELSGFRLEYGCLQSVSPSVQVWSGAAYAADEMICEPMRKQLIKIMFLSIFILILRKSTHLIFMRDCIQIHGWF